MTKINDGARVAQALALRGLETPRNAVELKNIEKKDKIQQHMTEVLNILGLDLADDSLKETPLRLAKMYVDELFYGLDYAKFPKITKIANSMQVDEMVFVDDITMCSTCEHHFVTIDGKVTVAYKAKDWVIGLSKINRVVDFFAKRPQVQERLTQQLLCAFQTILETDDVAVFISATHYCVKCRGIQDTNSYTVTSAFGGEFKADKDLRKEFLGLIKK